MTTPKFRYLIITEDDEVFGTSDEDKKAAYAADLYTVIDMEAGTICYDDMTIEAIEEAPEYSDDLDDSEDPDA